MLLLGVLSEYWGHCGATRLLSKSVGRNLMQCRGALALQHCIMLSWFILVWDCIMLTATSGHLYSVPLQSIPSSVQFDCVKYHWFTPNGIFDVPFMIAKVSLLKLSTISHLLFKVEYFISDPVNPRNSMLVSFRTGSHILNAECRMFILQFLCH